MISALMLLVLSPCAAGAKKAPAATGEMGYRVDLTRPDTGMVGVTLEIDTTSQPLILEALDSYGQGLAVDLSSHITEEEAADASGKDLPLRRDGNTWYIEGSGKITFNYKVEISGYTAGTDYLDSLAGTDTLWPFFPFLNEGLAYLPGYAIFIHPPSTEDCSPGVELVLPPEWQQALPWADNPRSMEDLLYNPIFAGDLALDERGQVLAALPSSSAAASGTGLAEYTEKAHALLVETESLLGGLGLQEGERLLIALLFQGEGDEIQDSYYPSTPFSRSVVLPAPSRSDILSDSSIEATARGLADLFVSGEIPVDREALWLTEGAAWYLQDLVPYRSGIWGARTFWDRFYLSYDAYQDARSRFPASLAQSGALAGEDADAAAMLCCGGASACAALDSYLGSREPITSDLTSFLRNLALMEYGETPLCNADLLALLEETTGKDLSFFFHDYIEGDEEIPASAFSSLNIAPVEEQELPELNLENSTSTSGWILLSVAIGMVFLIPFILEPYTMRPRKPGPSEKNEEE